LSPTGELVGPHCYRFQGCRPETRKIYSRQRSRQPTTTNQRPSCHRLDRTSSLRLLLPSETWPRRY
jgi:hypothetical protein